VGSLPRATCHHHHPITLGVVEEELHAKGCFLRPRQRFGATNSALAQKRARKEMVSHATFNVVLRSFMGQAKKLALKHMRELFFLTTPSKNLDSIFLLEKYLKLMARCGVPTKQLGMVCQF
jgi:hypothetical protein